MSEETSINDYLAHLVAQANKRLNKQLSESGVPLEQWRILRTLSDSNGMTMRELADSVSLNRPTMTKTVDKLVAEALVYRVPDANDRRKVRIFLSDHGKALFIEHDERVSKHQVSFETDYGVEESAKLKSMLEQLIKQIS